MIDKLLVKKRFEKTLETYDENAIIQNYMGNKLVELLKRHQGDSFARVFEFGVGSANLTRLITENLSTEELFLNDIVKESKSWANKYAEDFEFLEGDVEKIDFPNDLDLVISNAAIQWVDFDKLLDKIAESLKSGASFAFSTFGQDNFLEISKIFGTGLNYLPLDILEEKLKKHFEILHIGEDKIELDFPNPKEVLNHIRHTGVNCCGKKSLYKSTLISFEQEYKNLFSTQDGVKLTYHPICVVAKKN